HVDGGADRPRVIDGSGDVSAATRAAQVCREAMILQCMLGNLCYGAAADPMAGCANVADRCPEYYFNPRSTRTVENVEACIAFFKQATCTDYLMGLAGACLAGGTGAQGAACSGSSECQSRSCSGYSPTCGTCGALAALGAPCGTTAAGSCGTGAICHPKTHVCVPFPLAVAHAGAGEPCDLQGNPPVGCTGQLVCVPKDRTQTAGTCTALPGAGQPCLDGPAARCATGLGCRLSTADGGRSLICAAPGLCGTLTCAPTEYCYEAPGVSLRCLPYAALGEACSFRVPEGDKSCVDGLFCTGTTTVTSDAGTGFRGTCHPAVDLGEACDAVHICREPLVCTAGHCAHFDPETCLQPPVDGGQH
ncbi:MAG TPA: hypothetical protein VHM31_20125, partial [Polyangia bacterium]|nr:hypothetical protein [Polyangia bacterium]